MAGWLAVIGPLLGGALSQWFGWRYLLRCPAAFGGAVVLPLLVLVVPETHQWFVLQQMTPQQQSSIKEREEILSAPPVMHAPWVPLRWEGTRQQVGDPRTVLVCVTSLLWCGLETLSE